MYLAVLISPSFTFPTSLTSALQQKATNLLGTKDRKTWSHFYWVIALRITAPEDEAMVRIKFLRCLYEVYMQKEYNNTVRHFGLLLLCVIICCIRSTGLNLGCIMTGNVKQRSTFWAFVLHPPSKETLNIDISLLQPFQCLPKIQATDQNWRQGTRSASKLHTMPGRKVSWGTDVVRRFLLVPTELQKFCHRKLAGLLHAVSLFKGHLHLG